MTNPNFTASISTNDLYRDLDTTVCLTDLLDGYDSSLAEIESTIENFDDIYALVNHEHNSYATSDNVSALQNAIANKADENHTHTGYAAFSHTHSDYVSMSAFNALEAEVDGKANVSHTHDYAASSHSHSNYSVIGHNHDEDYSATNHTHDGYATTGALNEVVASVAGKADASHTHAVDNALSSTSTNPVQNKVVNSALAGKVPTTRTVNGKVLSSNITLSASDVGADASGSASSALTSARAYTDQKIDALVGEGASTTLDTIGEISAAIEDNQDAIDLLNSAIGAKANAGDLTSHTSNKSNPHGVTLAQLGVTATAAELNKMDGITATTAELNKMDGVTATTSEINYLDGATSNIQSQLNSKAASSHGTHVTYGTTAPKANGAAAVGTATTVSRSDHVHPLQTTVSGNAGTATKLATARTISLAGDVTGSASFDGSANASITATVADDSHNHVISNVDGLQSVLNAKAASSHTHNYAGSSSAGGAATSANKLATARTISLTGDVTGSTSFDGSGNVSIAATVADDSHNHTIANVDGLQSALNGKSATSHNHDSDYVSKDLQAVADNGSVEYSYVKTDNKNILTEMLNMPIGMHTVYSQSGCTGNPKTTEAWRYLVHKTSSTVCWVQAYGSVGSVYTNYHDGSNGWRGWKCLWDNSPEPLWSGAMYMSSPNSTPQTVTPSKKLSECAHGWLLLWSDYDPGEGANDSDFVTTMIPKRNPSGGTWGGKSFLCDIPRYVGSDASDTTTEKRIIKPIYVHDNCLKGSYQNASSERSDVVLRAVYEY